MSSHLVRAKSQPSFKLNFSNVVDGRSNTTCFRILVKLCGTSEKDLHFVVVVVVVAVVHFCERDRESGVLRVVGRRLLFFKGLKNSLPPTRFCRKHSAASATRCYV